MLAQLIAECSDYDFKREVEISKPKSWLKSVSAFANGVGGSLYFGVNDNGVAIGLQDVKASCDKISELVNQRIEPKPIYRIIPFLEDGLNLIELRVSPSQSTPYYYRSDGVRIAYIRSGNESIEAPNYILNELILKGTGRTFDSIVTGHRIEDFSFAVLKAKFLERTGTVFSDDDFVSFMLATKDGYLTNAGLLLSDNPPFISCRLFATKWNGLDKVNEDEVDDDKEFGGSILLQLDDAISFFDVHSRVKWKKQDGDTLYQKEYDKEAVYEALVNGLIHRDYNNMGAEVCLNMYDDRIEITSPGGMYSGDRLPEFVDFTMKSSRRNPVIADVFWRMRLMNRRGSGLENITNKTNALFGGQSNHVRFKSDSFFSVTIDNAIYAKPGIKNGTNGYKLSSIESAIIGCLEKNPTISMKEIALNTGAGERTVARYIKILKEHGIIEIQGRTKSKKWIVK